MFFDFIYSSSNLETKHMNVEANVDRERRTSGMTPPATNLQNLIPPWSFPRRHVKKQKRELGNWGIRQFKNNYPKLDEHQNFGELRNCLIPQFPPLWGELSMRNWGIGYYPFSETTLIKVYVYGFGWHEWTGLIPTLEQDIRCLWGFLDLADIHG